jgi:glycosyltransferase involved in cell wall biosynthesis
MRILFSNEFYELYRGDKDYIMPKQVAENGYEVYLLAPNKISSYDEEAGFCFEDFRNQKMFSSKNVYIYSALRLIKKTHNKKVPFILPNPFSYFFHLVRIKPDVIVESIYTTLTPRSFLNYFYCSLFRKKRILMDAGDEAANKRLLPFENCAMHQASAIFSYSQGGIERIKNKYSMSDYQNFIFQPKVLNTERFYYTEPINNSHDKIVVGYVGRLLYSKGFDKFLITANELNRTHKNFRFIVAGINQDKFELPLFIEYLDYIAPENMGNLYREIDFLLLPDMSQFNSYATVVQEGLMCGCNLCIGTIDQSFYPETFGIYFYNPNSLKNIIKHISKFSSSGINENRENIASYYLGVAENNSSINILLNKINDYYVK